MSLPEPLEPAEQQDAGSPHGPVLSTELLTRFLSSDDHLHFADDGTPRLSVAALPDDDLKNDRRYLSVQRRDHTVAPEMLAAARRRNPATAWPDDPVVANVACDALRKLLSHPHPAEPRRREVLVVARPLQPGDKDFPNDAHAGVVRAPPYPASPDKGRLPRLMLRSRMAALFEVVHLTSGRSPGHRAG